MVGDGTVQSNDADIAAEDGSAVAFGDGSTATADTQDVEIDDNYGTVQLADDGTQTGATDNSVNDSGNATDSGNFDPTPPDNSIDNSFDIDVSGSYNDSSDNSVDNSSTSTTARPRPPPGQRRHRHPLIGRQCASAVHEVLASPIAPRGPGVSRGLVATPPATAPGTPAGVREARVIPHARLTPPS